MRGTNDDEVVPLARWARDEGYELRFIEWMPLDFQAPLGPRSARVS